MLVQILLGSLLVVVTTVVHGGTTVAILALRRRGKLAIHSRAGRVLLVALGVLLLFFVALLEAALWAGAYLSVGAIPTLEKALYFSVVTFTTLGYGDVLLGEQWRLMASFQAITGIVIFGWTTALIVALVQHFATEDRLD